MTDRRWKLFATIYLSIGVLLAIKLNVDQHWCITQKWGPNALRMVDPVSTYIAIILPPLVAIMTIPGALAQNEGRLCMLGGK